MILENQVCTLEQAKRLKELGVEQTSLFRYEATKRYQKGKGFVDMGLCLAYAPDTAYIGTENYSAFTVAELGVLLPCFNKQNGKGFWLAYPSLSDEINEWVGVVETPSEDHSETIRTICKGDTEAQARAAMLIYLLENGNTTAEEVNQRLLNA